MAETTRILASYPKIELERVYVSSIQTKCPDSVHLQQRSSCSDQDVQDYYNESLETHEDYPEGLENEDDWNTNEVEFLPEEDSPKPIQPAKTSSQKSTFQMRLRESKSKAVAVKSMARETKGKKDKNNKPEIDIINNIYLNLFPNKEPECPLCHKKFHPDNGRKHLVKAHPDLLFADCKLEHIAEEQFQLYCTNLLDGEMKTSVKIGYVKGRLVYGCNYCQEPIKRLHNLLFHLVRKHCSVLKQKLLNLQGYKGTVSELTNFIPEAEEDNTMKQEQEDSGSELIEDFSFEQDIHLEIPEYSVPQPEPSCKREKGNQRGTEFDKIFKTIFPNVTKYSEKEQKCPVCRIRLHRANCRAHLVEKHPDLVFSKFKLDTCTQERFKLCCSQLLNLELRTAQRKESVRGNPVYGCDYCQESIQRTHQFRLHLTNKHFSILKDQLIDLQSNSGKYSISELADLETVKFKRKPGRNSNLNLENAEEAEIPGSSLFNLTAYQETKKKNAANGIDVLKLVYSNFYPPSKPEEKEQECPDCKQKFHRDNGKRHLVTDHADIVFADFKQEYLTEEQFKLCCTKVMNLECELADQDKLNGRPIYKCRYCQDTIQRTQQYHLHLVYKHFNELRDKLEDLQQDPGQYTAAEMAKCTVEQEKGAPKSRKKKDKTPIEKDGNDKPEVEELAQDGNSVIKLEPASPEGSIEWSEAEEPDYASDSDLADKNQIEIDSKSKNLDGRSKCTNWKRLQDFCETVFETDRNVTGTKFKCLLCCNITPLFNRRGHLIREHPETLFETCKPKNITDDQFHNLSMNVLVAEVLKGEKIQCDNKRGSAFRCHLCNINCACRDNFRYHLASKHFQILKEIFITAKDKHPNLLLECKIRGDRPAGGRRKRGKYILSKTRSDLSKFDLKCLKYSTVHGEQRKCSFCSCFTTGKDNFLHHVLDQHVEHIFREIQLEGVTNEQFGKCWEQIFTSELDLGCKVGLGKEYKCYYCESPFKESTNLKLHLVSKHLDMIEDNVVRLQNEQVWNSKGNDDGLPVTSMSLASKRKGEEISEGTNDKLKACKISKLQYQSQSSNEHSLGTNNSDTGEDLLSVVYGNTLEDLDPDLFDVE